jgi:hypothetical protein
MKNTNNILMITLVAVIILLSWGLTENYNKYNAPILEKKSCKEDSLRKVVDSLNTELEILNDGFHYKEQRYEEIIYEFEQKYKQKVPPGKYSPVN